MKNKPFQVYFQNGVRIYGNKIDGGYQLIKYDINLPLDFSSDLKTVTVRGEYLRNGRLWTDLKAMYLYIVKYGKHTVRPNQKQYNIPTAFDRKRSKAVLAKHKEIFNK